MLLDLPLSTPSDKPTGMHVCTANLNAYINWTKAANYCAASDNMGNATSPVKLSWDVGNGKGNATKAVTALEQLYAYELMNPSPCNETINFAYSDGVAVGLYTGAGLHGQSVLVPVLKDLVKYVLNDGLPETLVAQRCGNSTARYSMGIFVSTTGDLTAAQKAVQAWRNNSCVASLEQTKTWIDITFPIPMYSQSSSNPTTTNSTTRSSRQVRDAHSHGHPHGYSHTHLHRRDDSSTCSTVQVVSGDTCATLATECGITAAEFTTYNPSFTLCSSLTVGQHVCCSSGTLPDFSPQPDDDDNCYSYLVKEGDTCAALAAEYDLTVDEIESYNTDIWGWTGCDRVLTGAYLCLSEGWPPMPGIISNAVCGPQANGTATVPHGTDLSTLNPSPGTAANGTNGCISNCGTDIIQSGAPDESFKVGYFEGYDLSRPCIQTRITDMDLSPYTHIHMSFATLNSDFSFNISTIKEQMADFAVLDGVKRIISVGGWDFSTNPSTYTIFRNAVSASANREALVILWDWNNTSVDPGCPAGDCLRSHVNLTETLSAMSMITKAGVSANKVVLGVSSYARSFEMTEPGCYTEMCTYTGPESGAVPGECTQTAGYISDAELAAIAEEEDDWAAYMDDDVMASRAQLYSQLNFGGIADWAIDLQTANGTGGSSAIPTVTAKAGVTLVWPPLSLSTTITITFPAWPTHVTYTSTVTKTLTWADAETLTYRSYSHIDVPTMIDIEPLTTDAIPVWYQQPT
ncbi:hypothetical protein BDW59DRAFT_167109 [Aspergillus cavernicola]|uniref:chitinase n=1 Tax=Aspergillus cavernicola TaxID=176166 RepID=A0ABR4HGE4_9EURO